MPVPKELKLTADECKEWLRAFVDRFLLNGDHPEEEQRPYNAIIDHSEGTPEDYTKLATYRYQHTMNISDKKIKLIGRLRFDFMNEEEETPHIKQGFK